MSISLLSSESGIGSALPLNPCRRRYTLHTTSELDFLHPLSFSADCPKTEDIPTTASSLRTSTGSAYAAGWLIIIHITCEITTTKQVIESTTSLQVLIPSVGFNMYVSLFAYRMQHHKEYLFFIIILKRQSDVITILYRSEPTALNHAEKNTWPGPDWFKTWEANYCSIVPCCNPVL